MALNETAFLEKTDACFFFLLFHMSFFYSGTTTETSKNITYQVSKIYKSERPNMLEESQANAKIKVKLDKLLFFKRSVISTYSYIPT